MSCPFCDIAENALEASWLADWGDVFAIRPLAPVIGGHALVIPREHVADALEKPPVTGRTMQCAAELASVFPMHKEWNLITSVGLAATQSVFHLHIHLVPRVPGDGLKLPWGGGG